MRRGACRAVLMAAAGALALAAASAQARADGPSAWSLQSRAWDGLYTLADTATALGCTIEPRARLDLAQLGRRDTVWLLHPTRSVSDGEWMRFVESGGVLVVLDDFGEAAPLLRRFGLRRTDVIANRSFDNNPALPIAEATGMGRLQTEQPLVANHPSALRGEVPASFRFSAQSGLLYELTVGDGLAILGADPSLLINNMLELAGNLELARLLLQTTCTERSGKILLLTDDAIVMGQLAMPPSPSQPWRSRITAIAAELNHRSAEMARRELPPLVKEPLLMGGLLLCLALLGLSGLMNEVGRPTVFDAEFFRAPLAERQPAQLFELMRIGLDDWWQVEGKLANNETKRRAHELHEQILLWEERAQSKGTFDDAALQSLYARYLQVIGKGAAS